MKCQMEVPETTGNYPAPAKTVNQKNNASGKKCQGFSCHYLISQYNPSKNEMNKWLMSIDRHKFNQLVAPISAAMLNIYTFI